MNKFYPSKLFPALLTVTFFSIVVFIACKKNNSNSGDMPAFPPDLITKISSSVSGFVTDENNQAVVNANVQFGSAVITTDKYGYFEAKNVDVVKEAATVTVTRNGYFKAVKTYIAAPGKSAFFRIKLMPKTIAGTVNGSSGGTVTLTNGLSIALPANSVVNASNNTAYPGIINVAAYWINPTDNDLPSIMPGDLRGINTDGNVQLLTTFGMAAVELTGSGGELLQIATGKKASLSLPIPATLASTAPASIPLWSFDETKGLWKQEAAAIRNGNNYTGEVSHFSFWNCDVPSAMVQLSATIVNNSNQPIPFALVKISVVGSASNWRYGYTDAAGYVSGAVPANAQLLFEVYNNLNCGTLLYTQNITAAGESISLGTVSVSSGNALATITGTVVNCSNAPVTNGYIMAFSGNSYTRLNLNNSGIYSGAVLLCNNAGNSVRLEAEDLTTHMTSSPVIQNIVPGSNTVPLIQVCGAVQQEFVNLIKNGIPQTYHYLLLTQGTSTSYGVFFYLDSAMTIFGGHLQILQTGIASGSSQNLISISTGGVNMVINNPPVNVSITEYGAIGQYMAGNVSGNFMQPPSNTPYAISCSFRIKRTF
jgi:hypothetical protein